MSRPVFVRWMAILVFVTAWAAPAHAQLPDGCAGADRERVAVYTTAAAQALVQGNTGRFVAVQREMESGLTKACRAALDRQQPVRVRCTASERTLVLRHYESLIPAILGGNVPQIFVLYENLEASVSPACWRAVNQHPDPRVQTVCSASELDVMASYSGPGLRAMQRLLMTGDMSQILQVAQEQTAKLSPECSQAVQQAARPKPGPQRGPIPMPGGVVDHGGGTWSAGGLGACTPSGCMAF